MYVKSCTLCGSRKYSYHPYGRNWVFQGEEGLICLIIQWVLVAHKRVTKKNHKNLPLTTIIYLPKYKRRAINDQLETHLKTQRLMN